MSDEYMLDDVVMELRDTLGMTEHADAVTNLRAAAQTLAVERAEFRREADTLRDRLAAAESRLLEIDGAEVVCYELTDRECDGFTYPPYIAKHKVNADGCAKNGGTVVELIPRPARWSKQEGVP